jgi:putative tryptophan/tyrosine transport system substrate-binding protein
VRRRDFITLIGGAAAWPLSVRAQQEPANIPRIGVLWPGATPPASPRLESFRRGLREQGYIEGRNVAIELSYAERGPQQLPELAAELVHLNVDVILASGDFAPKVAQQATATVPIVAFADDILGAGLVTNLSRPNGNTTGLTIFSSELSAKRLEVLKNISPGISRVAALWDPTTGTSQVVETRNAAQSLNVSLQILEVRHGDDLSRALEAAKSERADALNVFNSPFLASLHRDIISFAAENRLPAIYQWRQHAEAGGLASYGPVLADLWRQCGLIVAKILKGARPSDLPVEQPARLELVINLKTAKALGIEVPLPLLIRADDLIE